MRSCDLFPTEILIGSLQNLAFQEAKKLASMIRTNHPPAREVPSEGFGKLRLPHKESSPLRAFLRQGLQLFTNEQSRGGQPLG